MSITGKQVEAALQIMQIVFETKRITPNVNSVISHASLVASLFTETSRDQSALSNAIVGRMVHIRLEVK